MEKVSVQQVRNVAKVKTRREISLPRGKEGEYSVVIENGKIEPVQKWRNVTNRFRSVRNIFHTTEKRDAPGAPLISALRLRGHHRPA